MIAACPNCEWSDTVEDSFLGQSAECPSCENDFVITNPGAQELPAAAEETQEQAAVNPYAAPSTSETLSVNDSGEVMEYGGMTRGPYWGWNFGLNFVSLIPILGIIVFIAGAVYIIRERCRNLGYNLWYGWTVLIPFYNILVSFRLACCPEGYADHKTLDKTAKILLGVMVAFIVLSVGAVALAVSMAEAAGRH
ncbi:hypothetical protein PQO01_02125 [Lentisphaera marina]|uniref:hypothetical protein n=1 Tax=Lentisphaera marina TaxID=1111041 RepID=UPI0023660614|nr:hypothetical protein [Lentisphaera marina]MDD7983742.1 hypothetical protein [Lentisphaera marina]